MSFTIINIVDASPMSVTCFWLYFVNKDIKIINEIVFYIVVTALMLVMILPESPRWLIINNRRTDTINTLNYIAKWNWSKRRIPKDAVFEEQLNTDIRATAERHDQVQTRNGGGQIGMRARA